MVSLVAMTGLSVPVLLAESETTFWVFALMLGVFMGPVQAASRSLMARLSPPGMETEMFGLFALSGKVTSFIGPTLVGWTIIVTDSQRIRSEEHTSELQSLMRISYAVFCL